MNVIGCRVDQLIVRMAIYVRYTSMMGRQGNSQLRNEAVPIMKCGNLSLAHGQAINTYIHRHVGVTVGFPD